MAWLKLLDVFFTILHLLMIGFNLLGWIWKPTRRLHLYGVILTASSWLVLGIWYGIGYCPITDWQWQVKTKLGEQHLPNSFVKYQLDKLTGMEVDAGVVDTVTAISFAMVTLLAIYLNYFRPNSTSLPPAQHRSNNRIDADADTRKRK